MTEKPTKNHILFASNRRAEFPRADNSITLRAGRYRLFQLYKPRVFLILRGSAAPEPKNTKNHHTSGPKNLKFFISRRPRKTLIFDTLSPLVLGTLPMERSVLLHAPCYYKYLVSFKSSIGLNLGVRSYARKTVQKPQIVSTSSDGQITAGDQ